MSSPDRKEAAERAALRRRRKAVAAHDLGHLEVVRRPAGGRIEHRGRLVKILRTDGGGRDGAEGLHVLAAGVVEPVNGAARNAEGVPRPDVDPFASTVQVSTPSIP